MSITSKFKNVFSKIDQQLVNNIKLFYLTKDNLLFVTVDDSVFHYNLNDKSLKKFESFYKNDTIIKFDCSDFDLPHYMALTGNGRVYGWCWQYNGGIEILPFGSYFDEPTLINSLSEEFIIDICCGHRHSLALTDNGKVYAIGDNNEFDNITRNELTYVKINISSKVTAISCGHHHSIALTENNDVFGWGWTYCGQLGIDGKKKVPIPMQLIVPKIKQISCGDRFTLMLSIDGDIYACGRNEDCFLLNIPTKLISSTKFTKIAATIHCKICVALSYDNKYFVFGELSGDEISDGDQCIKEVKASEFTSFEETYALSKEIAFKSINVSKYRDNFTEEITPLGFGSFSSVFKCKHNLDNKIYAMKKIIFEPKDGENVRKELNMLSAIQSEYVVKYIDSWIERNYYFDTNNNGANHGNNFINWLLSNPKKTQLMHIQMKLCSYTLRDAINIIMNECMTPDNTISLEGYFIASELFNEGLECGKYLHSLKPAIIHRDLKPENILITNFANNRCVVLSDFGLSTFHEFNGQPHSVGPGTKDYRAPEVVNGRTYTTKADIYSFGVIMEQLFQIDHKDPNRNYLPEIKEKLHYLLNEINGMLTYDQELRTPNCDKLLNEKHLWLLNDEQLNVIANQRFIRPPNQGSLKESLIDFFVIKRFKTHFRRQNITQPEPTQPQLKNPTPMEFD